MKSSSMMQSSKGLYIVKNNGTIHYTPTQIKDNTEHKACFGMKMHYFMLMGVPVGHESFFLKCLGINIGTSFI